MIGEIEGRTQAVVECGNGVFLPGTFFAHFFKEYTQIIRFFQVHQAVRGSFTLKIVPGDKFSNAELDEVINALRTYVGTAHETPIRIDVVAEIPLVRTGKRSPVVSDLQYDFQEISSGSILKE